MFGPRVRKIVIASLTAVLAFPAIIWGAEPFNAPFMRLLEPGCLSLSSGLECGSTPGTTAYLLLLPVVGVRYGLSRRWEIDGNFRYLEGKNPYGQARSFFGGRLGIKGVFLPEYRSFPQIGLSVQSGWSSGENDEDLPAVPGPWLPLEGSLSCTKTLGRGEFSLALGAGYRREDRERENAHLVERASLQGIYLLWNRLAFLGEVTGTWSQRHQEGQVSVGFLAPSRTGGLYTVLRTGLGDDRQEVGIGAGYIWRFRILRP